MNPTFKEVQLFVEECDNEKKLEEIETMRNTILSRERDEILKLAGTKDCSGLFFKINELNFLTTKIHELEDNLMEYALNIKKSRFKKADALLEFQIKNLVGQEEAVVKSRAECIATKMCFESELKQLLNKIYDHFTKCEDWLNLFVANYKYESEDDLVDKEPYIDKWIFNKVANLTKISNIFGDVQKGRKEGVVLDTNIVSSMDTAVSETDSDIMPLSILQENTAFKVQNGKLEELAKEKKTDEFLKYKEHNLQILILKVTAASNQCEELLEQINNKVLKVVYDENVQLRKLRKVAQNKLDPMIKQLSHMINLCHNTENRALWKSLNDKKNKIGLANDELIRDLTEFEFNEVSTMRTRQVHFMTLLNLHNEHRKLLEVALIYLLNIEEYLILLECQEEPAAGNSLEFLIQNWIKSKVSDLKIIENLVYSGTVSSQQALQTEPIHLDKNLSNYDSLNITKVQKRKLEEAKLDKNGRECYVLIERMESIKTSNSVDRLLQNQEVQRNDKDGIETEKEDYFRGSANQLHLKELRVNIDHMDNLLNMQDERGNLKEVEEGLASCRLEKANIDLVIDNGCKCKGLCSLKTRCSCYRKKVGCLARLCRCLEEVCSNPYGTLKDSFEQCDT